YDSNGYAISTEHGGKEKFTFSYTIGEAGALTVRMTNPLGKATTYQYEKGNLKSVTGHASTNCPLTAYSEIEYDANGHPLLKSDCSGNTTTFQYNAKGQLLQKIAAYGTPQARTRQYTWSAAGNHKLSETLVG